MTCRFCGAQLPEGATFCPACNQNLIEKTELRTPKPRKKKILALCLAVVLVLAAAVAVIGLTREPETSYGMNKVELHSNKEGVGKVTLDDGGFHYEAALCSDGSGLPNKHVTVKTYSGKAAVQQPCQLIVTQDGELMGPAFLEELESLTVEVVDVVGEPMTVTEPVPMPEYPNAAAVSIVTVSEACESAVLLWSGRMKSGVTFSVRQNITADVSQVIRYFADEYPMETDEELDALLAEILETTPENALIQLFLPAVTYEKPHTFADRSYQVLGNIDGDEMTTFLAPVTFHAENKTHTDLQNAVLRGGGSGTAVSTNTSTALLFCTVENWQTGAETSGSGSIGLEDCVFSGNRTAVRWNSESLYTFSGDVLRTEFRDNGVAYQIENLPGKLGLTFPNCVFSGNGTDIENRTDIPVDLSDAAFD